MTQLQSTVFVVDDDLAVLQGLRLLLRSVKMNVQTYSSAQEFLNSYDPAQPGCLVLDIRMPGLSGLELQEALNKKNITIPVIIITGYGEVPVAVRAMKNGAVDFLEKPFDDQVLLEQIRKALAKDSKIRQKQALRKAVSVRLALLTPREREVMERVIAGKANKVIARELNISQKTIEFHRAHIMEKMQVDSVAELVTSVVSVAESQRSVPNSSEDWAML